MEDKELTHSPLIEVIAEFIFEKELSEDQCEKTLAGLEEEYRKDFPNKSNLEINTISVNPDTKETTQGVIKRTRFAKKNNNLMFQMDKSLIAINHLEPYSGWSEYLPFVKTFLEKFSLSVPSEELHFKKITLRYINRLNLDTNFPDKSVKFIPNLPLTLSNQKNSIQSFISGVVLKQDHNSTLKVQLNSAPLGKISSFLLDFEFVAQGSYSINNLDSVESLLNYGHNGIREVFDTILSPELEERYR